MNDRVRDVNIRVVPRGQHEAPGRNRLGIRPSEEGVICTASADNNPRKYLRTGVKMKAKLNWTTTQATMTLTKLSGSAVERPPATGSNRVELEPCLKTRVPGNYRLDSRVLGRNNLQDSRPKRMFGARLRSSKHFKSSVTCLGFAGLLAFRSNNTPPYVNTLQKKNGLTTSLSISIALSIISSSTNNSYPVN